jgi:hypothetical protein
MRAAWSLLPIDLRILRAGECSGAPEPIFLQRRGTDGRRRALPHLGRFLRDVSSFRSWAEIAGRGRAAAPVASAAASPWRAGGSAWHEGAGKGRRLLAVLLERGLKAGERPVALREADPVNRQIVHEARVEHMLGITVISHARSRLLGQAQKGAEGLRVLHENGFVTEVTRHFGEEGEELVHGHRRAGGAGALLKITRQTNLDHRSASIRSPTAR